MARPPAVRCLLPHHNTSEIFANTVGSTAPLHAHNDRGTIAFMLLHPLGGRCRSDRLLPVMIFFALAAPLDVSMFVALESTRIRWQRCTVDCGAGMVTATLDHLVVKRAFRPISGTRVAFPMHREHLFA